MIERRYGGHLVLQFPSLLGFPELRHGVFTRNGGCSSPPFRSLNVGLGVGDDPAHVARNRQLVAECFDGAEWVYLKQVHGDGVHLVAAPGPASGGGGALVGDAVVTHLRNRMLAVQVADCQAVLLYDPIRHVIANVHSGWRGSILDILDKTVRTMVDRYACLAGDVFAGIGPSLGPCCGEFVNYRDEIPSALWQYKDESDHFDFWAASRDQLCQAGVPEDNIHISRICTRCNIDSFFSYRAEGRTGRFPVAIGMV